MSCSVLFTNIYIIFVYCLETLLYRTAPTTNDNINSWCSNSLTHNIKLPLLNYQKSLVYVYTGEIGQSCLKLRLCKVGNDNWRLNWLLMTSGHTKSCSCVHEQEVPGDLDQPLYTGFFTLCVCVCDGHS